MNNAPATRNTTAPALPEDGNTVGTELDQGKQHGISRYSAEDRDRLRAVQNIGDASDADLDVLFAVAQKVDLDPMMKEIYLVGRKTKVSGYNGERDQYRTAYTVQTGIDGFRKVTHRYAASKGLEVQISAPIFYDDEGRERPFWSKKFGDHPEAAKVTVSIGNGHFPHVVPWDEYVQTKAIWKSGKKAGEEPNSMWSQYGSTMLAKCAEAGAHRRACPLTAGLYIPEELHGNRAAYNASAIRLDNLANQEQAEANTAQAQEAMTELVAEIEETDDHTEHPELAQVMALIATKNSYDELKELHAEHAAKFEGEDLAQFVAALTSRKNQVEGQE